MNTSNKHLLLGTASLAIAPMLAFAPFANAADMLVKAPLLKAPKLAPTWTGCYIGVAAGGASQRSQYNQPLELDFTAGDNSSGSFIGGGLAGCNYQTGMFVFGLEGDYSGLSKPTGTYFTLNGDTSTSYGSHVSWMATVRGRVGVTFGDGSYLLYATGGAAFTKVNATGDQGAPFSIHDYSASRTGWVAGGGLEKMVTPNLILGLEGLFADFGSYTSAGNVSPTKCCTAVHNTVGIGRARLSFKF